MEQLWGLLQRAVRPWGGGFTHIGSSFTFSGPSLMLKADPTPSPLGPSLPKSVALFLPNPSPTLRPLP